MLKFIRDFKISAAGRRHAFLVAALVVLTFATTRTWAQSNPFAELMGQMQTSAQNVAGQLVPSAFNLLGLLFLIQFSLRNYRSVFEAVNGGEFIPLLSKVFFSLMWVGFLTYLINNNFNVLNSIYSGFSQLGSKAAGGVSMDPGTIAMQGVILQDNLQASFNAATGADDSFLQAVKNILPALLLAVACVGIMISFFVMAVAVAIATLEFYLIVAAAPIAYATGALDALKQSGIAPLQTVLSVGYRILILGVIIGIVHNELQVWDSSFSTITAKNWDPAWIALLGSGLGAVAAFHSGKIAGALASGQSNLSGSDAMAAGLSMMNTIANTTMATAASMGMLAAGINGGKGLAGSGLDAAAKGFTTMQDAFGSRGGTMSGSAGGGGSSGGGSGGAGGGGGPAGWAGGGQGAGASGQQVSDLLGPMGSDFSDLTEPDSASDANIDEAQGTGQAGNNAASSNGSSASNQAPESSGAGGSRTEAAASATGDAGDAAIGAPGAEGAGGAGNGGSAGRVGGSTATDVGKALSNLQKSMDDLKKGARPSHAQQLGQAVMKHANDMQLNDGGGVHVHVDPRAAGE